MWAIANPASAGPTTRVVLTAAMLRANALVKRARPTVLAMIAWRAGTMSGNAVPINASITSRCPYFR